MATGQEGLLHLGTMAVLLTAGYVGYDRIRRETSDFYGALKELRERVTGRFFELDCLKDGVLQMNPIVEFFEARLLCHVAGITTNQKRGTRIWYWLLFSIWHAPGLCFFRHKIDRKVIIFLCIISLAVYLFLVASTVWSSPSWETDESRQMLFWFFSATILITFLALICSHRVQAIEEQYTEFNRQIDQRKSQAKIFLDNHT